MSRKYLVIYERAEGNWSAYVPDLPGCVAAATSRTETESLIREAISLHFQAIRADGAPVPAPTSEAFLVAVAG